MWIAVTPQSIVGQPRPQRKVFVLLSPSSAGRHVCWRFSLPVFGKGEGGGRGKGAYWNDPKTFVFFLRTLGKGYDLCFTTATVRSRLFSETSVFTIIRTVSAENSQGFYQHAKPRSMGFFSMIFSALRPHISVFWVGETKLVRVQAAVQFYE